MSDNQTNKHVKTFRERQSELGRKRIEYYLTDTEKKVLNTTLKEMRDGKKI